MKTLNFFLILSFVIGILCACNKLSAEQTKNIDSTEHCYAERMQTLKLKADSALVCLCAHGYGQSSTNKTPVFSNVIGSYSQGCPVISNEAMKIANRLLKNTKKSTLLWIYY